jgi:hypothetical protein
LEQVQQDVLALHAEKHTALEQQQNPPEASSLQGGDQPR